MRAIGGIKPSKRYAYHSRKIIHDPIWGTCWFEPWEISLIDLGAFQRLRDLHQTGFAYFTYPSAEHSRFQHTLGVAEAARKLLQSVLERTDEGGLSSRGQGQRDSHPLFRADADRDLVRRLKAHVRLAALVHDLGHSVFSHSSERIFSMIDPFPGLIAELTSPLGKPPGAAEVVVYLLVTSQEWIEAVEEVWHDPEGVLTPPSAEEWERIGRWVMGQEGDPNFRFLADIISGPFDADKLDYVFRDGYAAGIPVGYDLQRLIATICVDPQFNAQEKKNWWRLTLPVRGVNALEQLVMGRLVLNSYLYHHQKCRAAECLFERTLAREYLAEETVLGISDVWKLFDLQDGDVLAFARKVGGKVQSLLARQLPVRLVEFRRRDLGEKHPDTNAAYLALLALADVRDWSGYSKLIELEDRLARSLNANPGDVIIDVPRPPKYADLENVLLPGRFADDQESPDEVLNYNDWIEGYNTHRAFIRVFGPRDALGNTELLDGLRSKIGEECGLAIPKECFAD